MRLAVIAGKCNILLTDGTSDNGMAQTWADMESDLVPSIIGYARLRASDMGHGTVLSVWPRDFTRYGRCLAALGDELETHGDDLRWRIQAVPGDAEPRDAAPITVHATVRDPIEQEHEKVDEESSSSSS
jgi:hypothetical protein